jgi:magnesium-transporting ATPase (P-type)
VRSFADGGRIITGMCGDGGNDCAALRAATFGFALSETDAGVGFVRNRRVFLTFYDQEWLHRSAAVTRASQA